LTLSLPHLQYISADGLLDEVSIISLLLQLLQQQSLEQFIPKATQGQRPDPPSGRQDNFSLPNQFFPQEQYGWLWMAMDGFGWLWMAMDGYAWLWMAVDGYGWLWMATDGYGRIWTAMDSK
jgi:hypothetical protein